MFSSSDKQQTSASPSLWDKLTGHSASHSTMTTSTMDAIATPDANISTPYNVSAGATGASMKNRDIDSNMSNANIQSTVMETESTLPVSSMDSYKTSSNSYNTNLNSNNQSALLGSSSSSYNNSQSTLLDNRSTVLENQSAVLGSSYNSNNMNVIDQSALVGNSNVDTCTKCITTTGPMVTMTGTSVVDVNQTAQVHFVGKQTDATISHESAALQIQVPAQTITTTLPAKRVIVEVPARQVQVTVPGRMVQLENAPEIQVTTRPVIKAVSEVTAEIRQGLAINGAEYTNSLVNNTNTIQNA